MRTVLVACNSSAWFGIRGFSAHGWLVLVLVFLALSPASAAETAIRKNVLILKSFPDRDIKTVDSLQSEMRARIRWPIDFDVENLEGQRLSDGTYEKSVVESLRHTYAGQKPDLVMPQGYPALQFVLNHRDELFPGSAILFWDIDVRRIGGRKLGPGVAGVTVTWDIRRTIDLALHLHPNSNTVAVITENSEFYMFWLALVHAELLRHQDGVREIDLVGLPTSQLLERLAALPLETVVLFEEFPQDSIQPTMGVNELLAWVGQRLPTYCVVPLACLNHGGIGGFDPNVADEISITTELAGRLLSGERPESIPVVNVTSQQFRADWRQLRRWNIPESALPPGSVVLFREPDLWERYGRYLILGIVALVLQSVLIVALVVGAKRRQRLVLHLKDLGRRLIDAQEEERRRIARELHDDLNQRVILLRSHIERLDIPDNDHVSSSSQVAELSQEAREISTGISHLSHQLHSSALEILGLEPALQGLTRDLALAYNLNIHFTNEGGPSIVLPGEVALCLFRVAQEALSNVVKHSGASFVEVHLNLSDQTKAIRLTIRDNGKGFDTAKLKGDSLGIISMRERLRLVDGELLVNSSPDRGTKVVAQMRIKEPSVVAAHA
jgi:signal transduction histidine kinase